MVWHDANNNGLLDNGEQGLPNVAIALYRNGQQPGVDAPLATTTTDNTGAYHFANLETGEYVLAILQPPADYPASSTPTNLNADSIDNDDNGIQTAVGGSIVSPVIKLALGQGLANNTNQTLDFGLYRPVKLGDMVWYDTNSNGQQDVGEPGAPNVRVLLYNATTNQPVTDGAGNPLSQRTDSAGHYLFTNLSPGNYYIVFDTSTLAPNVPFTQPNVGDDATDSDVDAAGKSEATGFLASGAERLTFDIGINARFDLALLMRLADTQATTAQCGDNIVYQVEIFNQGTLPATNIAVTDYIPTGLSLNDGHWTVNGGKATQTIPGPLAPGASTKVTITLRADATCTVGGYSNAAEINSAQDWQGQPTSDVDSLADSDSTNDGVAQNDVVDGNRKANPDSDEDDADFETLQVGSYFDLALRMRLASTQASPINPGDKVDYVIEIFNQGTMTATNISIVDYIPDGMRLADANWLMLVSKATKIIRGPLAPGQSTTVTLTLQIAENAAVGTYMNLAELSDTRDANSKAIVDVDSLADTDSTNDGVVQDDVIDQNHKANPMADEDDADQAGIVVGSAFDLALRTTLATSQPDSVAEGANVVYTIRVFNQGALPATNIDLVDYVPTGMTLNDAAWSIVNGKAHYLIPGPLQPGAFIDVSLTLRVNVDASPKSYMNKTEIASAQNALGQPQQDVDSTFDSDPTNDGTMRDDVIDGNHLKNSDDDEDDQDGAAVKVGIYFDLALRVTLAVGQPTLVKANDNVTFVIEVLNQGMLAATNIEVTDYIPNGMVLNDTRWTLSGDHATRIIPGPLLPGESIKLEIVFAVASMARQSSLYLIDWAEISSVADGAGNPRVDVDSVPDDNPNNDGAAKDNIVDEDFMANTTDDEDDDDYALVKLGTPTMSLKKKALAEHNLPGEQLDYTLTFTNTSGFDATSVVIKEMVPPHTRFDAANSSPNWQCADVTPGSVCTYNIGTLPANAAGLQSLAFAVIMDENLPSDVTSIQNEATVDYDGVIPQTNLPAIAVVLVDFPTNINPGTEPSAPELLINKTYLPLVQK